MEELFPLDATKGQKERKNRGFNNSIIGTDRTIRRAVSSSIERERGTYDVGTCAANEISR